MFPFKVLGDTVARLRSYGVQRYTRGSLMRQPFQQQDLRDYKGNLFSPYFVIAELLEEARNVICAELAEQDARESCRSRDVALILVPVNEGTTTQR